MPAASYVPAKLAKAILNGNAPVLLTDTLICGSVVAGAALPDTSKSGIEFISDLLVGNAEVTGTGYARQTLAGKTWAFDSTGTRLTDFGFTNITFSQNAAGPTGMRYFFIAKNTGSDATSQILEIFDPNATYSMQTGDVVLSAPAGGAIQAST